MIGLAKTTVFLYSVRISATVRVWPRARISQTPFIIAKDDSWKKARKARAGLSAEKSKALAAALAQIEKQFGKGSIMRLGAGEVVEDIQVVSTGSLGLDIALGVGGLPRGRVVEIYGPESSGKTTLTLQVIAEMQKLGGTAAFIDAEHALDVQYAQKLGVNAVRPADLAAGHGRAGAGNRRRAGALGLDRHDRHRLGRGARCRRPKSKAKWATRCRVCRRG